MKNLTPDPQTALAALHRFVQSPERLFLLTGYAGTGKTTLLHRFIQELRASGDDRPVVATCATVVGGGPRPTAAGESPCFREVSQRAALTEVVRYGSAIGAIAAELRQNLERPTFPAFRSDIHPDRTEGCFVLSRANWEKHLLRAFQSEGYQQNPDRVRALAYTNRRVRELNRMIRTALYGHGVPRFIAGERLIAVSPCLRGENIVLPTSAECEVTTIERGTDGPCGSCRWLPKRAIGASSRCWIGKGNPAGSNSWRNWPPPNGGWNFGNSNNGSTKSITPIASPSTRVRVPPSRMCLWICPPSTKIGTP